MLEIFGAVSGIFTKYGPGTAVIIIIIGLFVWLLYTTQKASASREDKLFNHIEASDANNSKIVTTLASIEVAFRGHTTDTSEKLNGISDQIEMLREDMADTKTDVAILKDRGGVVS